MLKPKPVFKNCPVLISVDNSGSHQLKLIYRAVKAKRNIKRKTVLFSYLSSSSQEDVIFVSFIFISNLMHFRLTALC